MVAYVLKYEYQTCFDDGGIGHDSWWQKSKIDIEAKDDDDAKEKAVKWIEERDRKRPCNGSFCSNRGGYRLVSVQKLTLVDLILR
jgi:hypothetical protein